VPKPEPADTAPRTEPAQPDARLVAEITSLKEAIATAQKLMQAQAEEQGKKHLELQKAVADAGRQLTEALVLSASSAREWQDRVANLEKERSARLTERSELARKDYLKGLERLHAVIEASSKGRERLLVLAQDLAKAQESFQLAANPEYQSALTSLRDKLDKSPLKDPSGDPAGLNAFLANPQAASVWTLGAALLGGGMLDSNKSKAELFRKTLGALDLVTRFDAEFKAFSHRLDQFRREGDAFRSSVRGDILRSQLVVDPSATEPLLPGAEALAAKLEALVSSVGAGKAPEGDLRGLLVVRETAGAAEGEHRLYQRQVAAFAGDLVESCDRFQKAFPARNAPALDTLLKSAQGLTEVPKAEAR
jgi:hypothetical protein